MEDDEMPNLFRSEDGQELSVYDLAIGARHADLDTDPDDAPDGVVRFDGILYLPVDGT